MKKVGASLAWNRRTLLKLAVGGLAAPALLRTSWAQNDAVRVGILQPLTGVNASGGNAAVTGVKVALETISGQGGVAGRPVELTILDEQQDLTLDVSLTKKLVEDTKVHAIIGPQTSQGVMAILPYIKEVKIPLISAAGSAAITPENGPYHFSTNISTAINAKEIAALAQTLSKSRKVCILSDVGAQSKDTVQHLQTILPAADIEIAGIQQFQYRAVDFTPQLLDLQGRNPDVLVIAPSLGEDVATIARGMSELGWDVPVVGNIAAGTLATTALQAATQEQLANFYGLSYKATSYCAGGEPDARYQDFVKRATAIGTITVQSAGWHDALLLIKAAIEGSGTTDGPTMVKWIEEKGSAFPGILGAVSASPTNHFLFGSEAVTFIKVATARADTTAERVTC